MTKQYIKIKDEEIPINIKNYKTSKSVKIYFKGNILNITKPKRLSIASLKQILKGEENSIYEKYKNILSSEISSIKQWKNGEKIYYKGDEFSIIRKYIEIPKINIEIEETKKEIIISVPKNIEQNIIKTYVDKMIKNIFKNNTEKLIAKRLPYWSKITGLKYNKFEIRDATTRFGSCMPSTKNVYFSSRLIMLAVDKVDAIIVHELCHMKYKYHNNDFYGLVSKYISNYKEIDTWLKKNSEVIMF